MLAVDHSTAFFQGTNVRTALRIQPEETRMALVKMVADLVQWVDAKKTLNSTEEITFTVEAILQQLPAMTLEEIRMAFDQIKMGKFKLYERLKTAEILDCLMKVDAARAELLERRHMYDAHQGQQVMTQMLARTMNEGTVKQLVQDLKLPEDEDGERIAWMNGKDNMSRAERAELMERDKLRRKQLPCSAHDQSEQ
jgi:hypothetical protein